jgi:glycosyltransferase involved in cell wall biosynthesis
MSDDQRPLVAVLDGSVDVTGAVKSVLREAELLGDRARFLLLLPKGARVSRDQLPNVEIAFLPIIPLRRSASSIALYAPGVLACAWQLARLLKARRAAVLQVNDFYLVQGFAARLFGWRGRTLTFVRIDPRRFGLPGRAWLAAARASSDRMIAVSRFIAGLLDGEATVLHDPVPAAGARARPAEASPTLLFVGNYISGKGQDAAIRAFHQVAAEVPEAELVFCGGDMGLAKNRAYRAELEALAQQGPGAERIRFLPFVADTRPLLENARAALNFSHSESFSLTCQEASFAGLPVIATRCGGPEEIVDDGGTGYLVEVDDVEAMADRMRRLLTDAELAGRMGARAAETTAARFDPARWRERMLSLLQLGPGAKSLGPDK